LWLMQQNAERRTQNAGKVFGAWIRMSNVLPFSCVLRPVYCVLVSLLP
jgi:hypothetical protein